MNVDWSPLQQELAVWRAEGLTLPLWWRDDDAVRRTPALSQLQDMSERLGIAVHLAVIPARAYPDLGTYIEETPGLIPVVHGWSHDDTAPKGLKRSEFHDARPLADMVADCATGLERLQSIFGPQLVPMFVPPWNRMPDDLIQALPGIGFHMVSTFTPRDHMFAAPGLLRVNTHMDPINWRDNGHLHDADSLVKDIAKHLVRRRIGRFDNTEPFGILTHHLVHDAPIWAFVEGLLEHLLAGPVDLWQANSTRNETGEQA